MHTSYFITGGAESRDLTEVRCTHADIAWTRYSGPIDAPSTMPAGACDSTTYCDWNGDFLVGETTIDREAA